MVEKKKAKKGRSLEQEFGSQNDEANYDLRNKGKSGKDNQVKENDVKLEKSVKSFQP